MDVKQKLDLIKRVREARLSADVFKLRKLRVECINAFGDDDIILGLGISILQEDLEAELEEDNER